MANMIICAALLFGEALLMCVMCTQLALNGCVTEFINDWPIYAALIATWAVGLGLIIEAVHRCLGEAVAEIVGTTFGMASFMILVYFSSFAAVTY